MSAGANPAVRPLMRTGSDPAVRQQLLQIAAQLLAADVRFDGGLSDQEAYVHELCTRSLQYARTLVRIAEVQEGVAA